MQKLMSSSELRRLKLSLKYYIKLKANPEHTAYDCVFDPLLTSEFKEKTKIPTFGIRMSLIAKDAGISIKNINDEPLATVTSPWSLAEPAIDISLSAFPKENTSTHTPFSITHPRTPAQSYNTLAHLVIRS